MVSYMNCILKEQEQQLYMEQSKQKQDGIKSKSDLFKSSKRSKCFSQEIDFAKIFSLDESSHRNIINYQQRLNSGTNLSFSDAISNNQNALYVQQQLSTNLVKFTYFVENEKLLSGKMLYVESQRQQYVEFLKKLKQLFSDFIKKKYKNCTTKIGFSSERELYNIFNRMLSSSKGFFNKAEVRKILSQFWMSTREVISQIRIRNWLESNHNSSQTPSLANAGSSQYSVNELVKISKVDEIILMNNFYMRLEIVTRGRFIYETHDSQLPPSGGLKTSSGTLNGGGSHGDVTKFQAARHYPIHQAIFENNLRQLSKLLKLEEDGIFYSEKNQLDACGNTPLMLAVKLGNIDAVKVLSDMYTCPKLRPLTELMNAKEIAIGMKHSQILKILISSNQKIKQQFFEKNKGAIFQVLERIPDFKVDLSLTCDSNWFPVFSSVAPSDTYKIYKQGSNLRLDMTLLGLQKFNLIKGNISVIYKGRGSGENEGEFLIVDNKLQTVNNAFNRNNENKVMQQIGEILSGKQVLKKYQTHNVGIEVETDRSKRPVNKWVNNYECQKYTLKSRYTMIKYHINLAQIDQIKDIKSFDEYAESLQADYLYLIEMHLDTISYEREDQPQQKGIGNFFKIKFGNKAENDAPLTSRINFGGTSKIENQGGFSTRENSQFKNLAEFNNYNQMHTQEDQAPQNANDNTYSNIFGAKKNSIAAGGQKGASAGQTGLQMNKQITIKKKQQKQISANLWLSKNYPFNIDQFLPLINVLSFCSKQIRQFNKFLLKYPIPEAQEYFPVQARIPLFMTMEAVFSFKNIQMNFNDKTVFDIDKEVAIKQNQNLAVYAKQQISYLNMHSSLDTQEDKQAKALKEIYKLCKTDEGYHSGEYLDGQDRKNGKADAVNENKQHDNGYESENSDRIKELFNQMLTNQDEAYDIKNDPLVVAERKNDQEDLLGQKAANMIQNKVGVTPSQINYQLDQRQQQIDQFGQSRNFADGGASFQDVRNSFAHSELLRKRKSGIGSGVGGRNPSKQFSLQSDITESIEVSEQSFNDKLTKLQIHSFQNVKFMSQFKKNMIDDKNLPFNAARRLEDFLADQYDEDQKINEADPQSQFKMSNLQHFQEQSRLTQKQGHQVPQPFGQKAGLLIHNVKDNANINMVGDDRALQKNSVGRKSDSGGNGVGAGKSPSEEASARGVEQVTAKPRLKNVSNFSNNFSHHSYMSSSMNHGENIYDSKINEERPKINKSLGKHQINNNLHMWTKMGAKIYKDVQPTILYHQQKQGESTDSQIIGEKSETSNKPPARIQNLVSSGTASRPKNYNNQLSNLGIINQSVATMNTVSGSTVKRDFQPRAIPRQKNQINNLIQPGNSGLSLGVSQIDNPAEVGSINGSSASGLLQSMSSFMGPAHYGGIGGVSQNLPGGFGSGEVGSGGMPASQTTSDRRQMTPFGTGTQQPHHGPNSTADSSVHKIAMTPSVLSLAPRESRDSAGCKGSITGQKQITTKNQPSILDKDKLKLILDNLRNDKPVSGKNQHLARPRYLNTIESEGNLPSQQFNNRGEQPQSLVSKASNNQLSQRSIHSLESLKSEGSQGERDLEYDRQGKSVEDNDAEIAPGRRSGHSSYKKYVHARIDNEIQQAQNFQERSQNVPMHTGDNGSQASHENHEGDYGNVGISHQHQQQVFSYEKQHRTRGLDNVNMMIDKQQSSLIDLTSINQRNTKRQDSSSQQPPQNKALHLRINPQANIKQQQSSQVPSLGLNFFQKVTNFIQESITDRKHHPSNNEYHLEQNEQRNDHFEHASNDDDLMHKNAGNFKPSLAFQQDEALPKASAPLSRSHTNISNNNI